MKCDLRKLLKWVEEARNFPHNTCPASRHLHMIAEHLAMGKPYAMLQEDPEQCAEAMLWVLESLWTHRTKTGWGIHKDAISEEHHEGDR